MLIQRNDCSNYSKNGIDFYKFKNWHFTHIQAFDEMVEWPNSTESDKISVNVFNPVLHWKNIYYLFKK